MLVDINLLPEKEKERSTLLIAALVILGVAILFWVVFFLYSHQLTKKTAHLETQIASLHMEQEALREDIVPTVFSSEMEMLAATVEWAEAYRYETLPLLQEMISLLPERGFFMTFEFAAPHFAEITVQFDEKRDAAHYLTRMKASAVVAGATIDSVTAVELEEEDNIAIQPRFEAVYQVDFLDERNTVVEVEGELDIDTEEQEDSDA